jgi:acetyl-CoA C-acetyltransferase
VKSGKSEKIVDRQDEQPFKADFAKIPQLKPGLPQGRHGHGRQRQSISDGAAALVLMREVRPPIEAASSPLATMVGHSDARAGARMVHHGPGRRDAEAAREDRLDAGSVDLYEINEAFAVVAMAAMHDLGLPHDKVNVHGGACALGHPIGASGARILVTLIGALRQRPARRAVSRACASAAAKRPPSASNWKETPVISPCLPREGEDGWGRVFL